MKEKKVEKKIDFQEDVVEKNRILQRHEAKCRALDHKKSMIECAVRMMLSKSNVMSEKGVADDWAGDESQKAIRRELRGGK